MSLPIKIINKSSNELPSYATLMSAGMDLMAFTEEGIVLQPNSRTLVHTGLYIELPKGYEAQIRPRSGLALNKGITVLNAPGTIDADYRGEIGVILYNTSDTPFYIKNGDRIAQMVVARCERVEWVISDDLSSSERGEGGFGSTGVCKN